MKFAAPILLVMLLLPLTACGNVSLQGDLSAFCQGTQITVDDHADALVAHGEDIISSGAGEVLVTGDQLITVYDKACKQ